MRRHFGIRARLAALVAIVFAVAATIGAIAIVNFVEHRLVANTRTSAESVLQNYLHNIDDGGPVVATIDPSEPGAFFYLDDDGTELSQSEYVARILAMGPAATGNDPGARQVTVDRTGEAATDDAVDPTAPPAGTQGIAISVNVSLVGAIHEVDRGDGVIAVAQRVRFADGSELEIGVASPLQPVTDSLHAIRSILWLVAPALTLLVGGLTYLTVRRALRPVHSITQRTRAITDTNLSERVPVPDSRDDIAELATTVNDMLARLDVAKQRQRRFIADASHELRSPIAASCAQLEVALAHPERADWSGTAATVLHEQTHLGQLVDDLLALSRLDEQGIGPTADVDLGELVTAEVARPHRSCVRAVTAGPARVVGNRSQLARALRNVVDNADRHAASTVTVTLERRSDRAVIHVDDDGPGIPPDQRDAVFDRFARVDDHRHRDHGGAGLGLAIVHQVARAHGGRAECSAAPSGGARLTLEFPTSR
jgi:signal transduction histidine kinase